MHNPFDPNKENDKFQIFKGITEAINDWMLKKYPEFDNKLIGKIKRIEQDQIHLENTIKDFLLNIKKIEEDFIKNSQKQINDFIKNEYPELNKDLIIITKKLKQQSILVDEKLKTTVKSDTLYEDVYKMRDEFKEIQKFMESFKKKIQKAFEI